MLPGPLELLYAILSLQCCVHKLLEGGTGDMQQLKLEHRFEPPAEPLLLLCICGYLITSISCKKSELAAVCVNIHVPLNEIVELLALPLQGAITDVVTPEKSDELVPRSDCARCPDLQITVPSRC